MTTKMTILPHLLGILLQLHATWDATSALAGDPINQRCTRSQFDRASSLLAQASPNYDSDTFAEASGHPDWDATIMKNIIHFWQMIHGILFLF